MSTQLAFQVDRVEELDRAAIRASVLERFSAGRMTDGYEAIYRAMLGRRGVPTGRRGTGEEAASGPGDGERSASPARRSRDVGRVGPGGVGARS